MSVFILFAFNTFVSGGGAEDVMGGRCAKSIELKSK